MKTFYRVLVVAIVVFVAPAASGEELKIYHASSPLGATSIHLANSPLGAESVHLATSPLGADVRLGFVEKQEDADLIIDEATSTFDVGSRNLNPHPFGATSVYFSSTPLGAPSVYFSGTSLGAKTIHLATSGIVDLKVHVKKWKGSSQELIAMLVALKKL